MPQTNPNGLTNDEVVSIASQAYTYGFPLVMMHLTKEVQTNVERPQKGHAPVNQFGRAQTFPTYLTQDVVKPNVDTFYNIIWFDLKDQEFVVNIPNTEQSTYDPSGPAGPRYTLLPFMDAYSNVFESLGTNCFPQTSVYLNRKMLYVCGPDCTYDTPDNMIRVQSPTNMVWLLGRIQANDDTDGTKVVWPMEQQLSVTPYNSDLADPTSDLTNPWNNPAYIPPQGEVKDLPATPLGWVAELNITEFFNLMTRLMAENPPPEEDEDIVASMQSIGIDAGAPFHLDAFDEAAQLRMQEIPTIVPDKWQPETLKTLIKKGEFPNNWVNFRSNIGRYGTEYVQRALIAKMGLGANIPIDAMYPVCLKDSDGHSLQAGQKYTLEFSQEPPNNAFWSLTSYNSQDYLVEPSDLDNPIYSVGSRSGTIKKDENGRSFTIYVQP